MSLSTHPQFLQMHQLDARCGGCWTSFPRPCRCGGQIHAEVGDENATGDIWLRRWYSKCGIDWDDPIPDES